VLVHGAFAESASWDGVVELLLEDSIDVVAAANPLRGLRGDAAYLRSVVAAVRSPVVLVGHSYGGIVVTDAASRLDQVSALVYVAAFAPDDGESALAMCAQQPGSMLAGALAPRRLASGEVECVIRPDAFRRVYAADVPADVAASMAVTQRPVTDVALSSGLRTRSPAWTSIPCWFVYGDQDRVIPVALHRRHAERARSWESREVAGASHAISTSNPDSVAASIVSAVRVCSA
jgi:pimeloyl-ACP methyl ester carboxylesterase